MSKKQQQKQTISRPPAEVESSLKKTGKRERNFSAAHLKKNQKLLLDGVLTFEPEDAEVFFKVKGTCHSKRKVENTHGVTVKPRLYYPSALTALSENGLLFHSGPLRVERIQNTRVWSLWRSQHRQGYKTTPDQLAPPQLLVSAFPSDSHRVHVFKSRSYVQAKVE